MQQMMGARANKRKAVIRDARFCFCFLTFNFISLLLFQDDLGRSLFTCSQRTYCHVICSKFPSEVHLWL